MKIFKNIITMMTLTEEQKNLAWSQFYDIFYETTGLGSYYDMEKLKEELLSSPCAINEEAGTAYKGALVMHINMICALAQRLAKMVSGTFSINESSLLKICCIMHLSKRHLYEINDNEWEIKNRGLNFKFRKDLEGVLKGSERSLIEAMNNGVNITPTEFEAIKSLDDTETNNNMYKSIYTTIVRQANELAYAIEKERYNKIKNQE
jgi:hypothetical protein